MELDANTTVKVAAEFNDKTGNHSIVKVATEIGTRYSNWSCPSVPVLTLVIFP